VGGGFEGGCGGGLDEGSVPKLYTVKVIRLAKYKYGCRDYQEERRVRPRLTMNSVRTG
jgi:hypothetical protein